MIKLLEENEIDGDTVDRKTIDCYFKNYVLQSYDCTIKIKDIGSAEANATDKGVIVLNSKNRNNVSKYVLDHEIAHQLCNYCHDLQCDVILNWGYAFGKPVFRNNNFIGFDGNYGGYNPEEAFCDTLSYYINYPNNVKKNYPDAYKVVEYIYNLSSIKKFYNDWYKAVEENNINTII